jgi:DNA-binding NarL/FixJ family response regulator
MLKEAVVRASSIVRRTQRRENPVIEPIPTYVHGRDPISQAGVISQLRPRPEIRVVDESDLGLATVAVVVADQVDEGTTQVLSSLRRDGRPRLLLVATVIDDQALVTAAEAGVVGLLRRADASSETLVRTVLRVASGKGDVPADLLGKLLEQVGRLQRQVLSPRGLTFTGLTPREAEVLRLVADGHDTSEIAVRLSYSERTVKNVLHDLTTRLQLRNRSHAVAYAVREGLI